jgi:DNA-binding response OmpR family regulator
LSTEGYEVRSAANGVAGLDGARRLHPDVILLDLAMPIMDGFAFRAAQLLDPDIAGIPVICISGRDDSREAVLELHMAGSSGKPFELDDLVHQVRDLTHGPARVM